MSRAVLVLEWVSGSFLKTDTGRMISRREFVAGSVALAVASSVSGKLLPETESIFVNDIHSQLNPTHVHTLVVPRTLAELPAIIRCAADEGLAISLSGSRHSMGGQPFAVSLPDSR